MYPAISHELTSFKRIHVPFTVHIRVIILTKINCHYHANYGDAGYHSSFLVLPSLCCLSVSIGGGGPLQRLGVDMSFTPGRGTLGPIPGRRFQREKGLTQTSVSVLLGMKSEHKPVGRDLMVSAFFHSGTPTVKLLRFFFFF